MNHEYNPPLPVNEFDLSLSAQIVFITEEKMIKDLRHYGYEVEPTFVGKIYTLLDPAMKHSKNKEEMRKLLVDKAYKIINKCPQ